MCWGMMMRKSVWAAVLAAAWMCGPAQASAAAPSRYAVIVGINDYADKAIPDLKYAESDAKAVYRTLTDPAVGRFPADNVTLLLGKDATPGRIKAALYKLRGVDKNDLVIVFYSGHGAKEGDEAFWVTQDAESKALGATSLTNSDIRKYLAKIPSQRLVVLLDCCYAASTVKKSLLDPQKLFGDFQGKGRVTIAGSADNQEALEYEDRKAGVFTHFLVQGLRGAADSNTDGVVTFDELWTHLGLNVRKASVKQGGLHEPVIITEGGITPQFLLTFNPTAATASKDGAGALRKLFAADRITAAQFETGRKALSEPAIGTEARARRAIFSDLAAGKLLPKYLDAALGKATKAAGPSPSVTVMAGDKPTLAVMPFDVLGTVRARDAGKILAERLLPMFARRYRIVDQAQLKRFCDQDDLTVAGLAEMVNTPRTKALSKAVKMRRVRYLVVGTISGAPDGSLSVTARITDWQRGTAEQNRFAQVRAENWATLERRFALLAGKLLGDVSAVALAPGGTAPPAAPGADKLTARIQKLESVETDLAEARKLYTDKHFRVQLLSLVFMPMAMELIGEVTTRFRQLQAEDAKLAVTLRPAHPRRQALAEQIDLLDRALSGILTRARTSTLRFTSGVRISFVRIPSGKFTMGSAARETGSYKNEGPQRQITISRSFHMGVTEVTQAQWRAVMGTEPWKNASLAADAPDNAANYMTWNDAQAFCAAFSKLIGRTVRLPTEAEWEYACRAGSATRFEYGDDPGCARLADHAWYQANAYDKGNSHRHAQEVGVKKPNAWGLYDMHGNVWEWCGDRYGESPARTAASDPKGPTTGKERVLRGGSWNSGAMDCRSASRNRFAPDMRAGQMGFRVVVETPAAAK